MSAPMPANETERIAALREYHILDTADEQVYDDITTLAAYVCGVPTAMISFVDASRQWFKARKGLQPQETARDAAFCAHTILQTAAARAGFCGSSGEHTSALPSP